MKELKQYIDPIQCYCALNESTYPILDSFNYDKGSRYKFSDFVVKVGLQLFIPIEYKSYKTTETRKVLAKNLYCVIYKGNNSLYLSSIRKSAKSSRECVSHFTNTKCKVVKCEIILLTQPQHLIKAI